MHKNEQICQKCAINCGIEGNASNENITKYKNLFGFKSILKFIQRFAIYRNAILIWIGRLFMFTNRKFRSSLRDIIRSNSNYHFPPLLNFSQYRKEATSLNATSWVAIGAGLSVLFIVFFFWYKFLL